MEGIALLNLARVHERTASRETARDLYEQALDIARETGDLRFEGAGLTNLAGFELDEGRLDEAGRLIALALERNRQVGNRRYEGIALIWQVVLERFLGDFAAARQTLAQAAAAAREVEDRVTLVQCVCEEGYLELAEGRLADGLFAVASELAATFELGADNAMVPAVDALRRASAAFAEGRRLLAGMLPEDVPEPLRRRLAGQPAEEKTEGPPAHPSTSGGG